MLPPESDAILSAHRALDKEGSRTLYYSKGMRIYNPVYPVGEENWTHWLAVVMSATVGYVAGLVQY